MRSRKETTSLLRDQYYGLLASAKDPALRSARWRWH